MLRVILSFDDGRKDNYRAATEIMKPLNIPATFNITTGYVLNEIEDNDKPGPHKPMDLEELRSLAACDLFEIAGHGFTHDNDIDNLVSGVLRLKELLPGVEISGIASPHSEFDLSEINKAKMIFKEKDIQYLRISNDYSKMGRIKIWIRRFNRILHLPLLYSWVNKDSIEYGGDFLLHSFPVIRDNKIQEVKGLISKLINNSDKDQVCILMFHSILNRGEPYYEDLFSWDYESFEALCKYLKAEEVNGKLILCKTADLFS